MKMQILFEKDRETKRTIRYKEIPTEGFSEVVGTLYVQKWFAKHEDKLLVTIEVAPPGSELELRGVV